MKSMEEPDWDAAYRKDPVFRTIYTKVMTGSTDGFTVQVDGTMTFDTTTGTKICIPAALLHEVLHIAHDTLGHMGYTKTYSRITQHYHRP